MNAAKFCKRCGLYMWIGYCECSEHDERFLENWANAKMSDYGLEFPDDDQED